MSTPPSTSVRREGLGKLGVKLYRYRNLVLRQWWILALTVAAGLAYQGWIISQMPQVFESTSQILIRDELVVSANYQKTAGTENFVGTQLQMLKSRDVSERARQQLVLKYPNLNSPLPEITPSVEPRTQIFLVKGVGPNPEYTRLFVDAVVQSFQEVRREQRLKVFDEIGGGYAGQAEKAQKEVDVAQAKLDEYVKANNMAFWTDQAKNSTNFLSGLKTRQAILQTELQRYQNNTPDQLLVMPPAPSAAGAGMNGVAGNSAGEGDGSGSLATGFYSMYIQKTQELSAAQLRLEDRARVWKPKHPRYIALKDDVTQLERAIELIKRQNRDATVQRIDAIKAELASLEQSITDWDAKVLEASAKDKDYQALQGNLQRAQEALNTARTGNRAITSTPFSDVFHVLEPARPAVEVDKGVQKHLVMGLIGGAVIGLIILILMDKADDRMTSSSEILDQFSEPILGQIPNVSESRGEGGLPLLQHDDERYTYAEAFRSLRSSLIFMPNQTELRTILVTSAIPNEGKSTVTSNLAITMAASGASVIVVDADLRRGDLASLFDMDGRVGLANVLRGEVPWQTATQMTRYPNLSLITRGPVTNQSSELLLLPTLNALLDNLRDNFDLIIFNTAPILATDDTPSLSPNFDGTLMVMRAQFTSARLTQNSLNALYQRQVNVLGLVLNCVDTEMPDYYYYRYPKYYATN